MDQQAPVLTAAQVAEALQTDPAHVEQLLDSGDLTGFKIGGEWRVVSAAVVEYIRRQTKKTQLDVLERALHDPHTWTNVLEPEEKEHFMAQEYEPGTMGAFLQEAIKAEAQEQDAENVVPIRPTDK